jgi:peptidoglycan hydrolase-like protein with peptidoglycan-binding domain
VGAATLLLVAIVSQGRTRRNGLIPGPQGRPHRRLRPVHIIVAVLVAVLAAFGAALVVLGTSKPSLVSDSQALARIHMPLGGGTVESVIAVTGPHSRRVPVVMRGNVVWPKKKIWAGRTLTIQVVVKRPGWISWLTGDRQTLQLTVTTPAAKLIHSYVTVKPGAPLRVSFNRPVGAIAYGPSARKLVRHVLPAPTRVVTLQRRAVAGSIWILGIPRGWEATRANVVSWFPAGASTSAVASPAPGAIIRPHTPITVTFSKPVSRALGNHRPPVLPNTSGSWRELNSHTIVFRPTGYGYGLGAKVSVALPSGVRLVGGKASSASNSGTWTVPPGSTLRLQQLLAQMGYLPLTFHGGSVANTTSAQEGAAVKPPSGSFSWRYGNTPSTLRNMWQPGTFGTITQGAVMRFEDDHGLTTDGTAGPAVWKALIADALAGKHSTFGYNFVMVSEGSPETLTMWHNGQNVFTVPVNTGIPSAPTALGTYPVFEHAPSVTMSGTNPDGSHYSDPGVPYVSYFNGGDALHGFLRSQYGSPQSLGCVEMSYADAGRVYPYTPIGTLVNVA